MMSETTKVSPKKQKPERIKIGKHLQLYNPSHKIDLLKLFSSVKKFELEGENSTSNNSNFEFEASDDEDISALAPVSTNVNADAVNDNIQEIGSHKLFCTSCCLAFGDLGELRSHYRLDWHRYNIKRKIHGQPPISDADFDEMIDDLSSIEGSDSENDQPNENFAVSSSRFLDKVTRLAIADETTLAEKSQTVPKNKLANSPKLYFENATGQIFGTYKPIAELGVNKRTINDNEENVKSGFPIYDFSKDFNNIIVKPLNIAIIMASGGHFAAAVFQGGEVITHKTFHSYTVRAKQGGSQSSRDAKSGTSNVKSSGASLRRYNEQSFTQHVQELIGSWNSRLVACQIIFYRAVSSNANVLFGGKNPPLQRSDQKLRTIPFPTKRPTFLEVKRVHGMLTALHVYDDRLQFLSEHLPTYNKAGQRKARSKKGAIDRAKSKSPKRHEDPQVPLLSSDPSSDEDVEVTEILEEIDFNHLKEFDDSLTPLEREAGQKRRRLKQKKPKPEKFPKPVGIFGSLFDAFSEESQITSLKEELTATCQYDEKSFIEQINQHIDFQGSNFLHLAVQKNYLQSIWDLLELGCDPAMKDKSGKYPYNYAETKDSREVFRRFMGIFPDKFDYKKAQVPAPITEEMEAEKAAKKRLINKLKREKEKQKKLEKHEKEKEINEKERYLNLSDREKRALAAEQRILAQCKKNGEKQPVLVRCFDCACDMTGKVPFEYNQNLFCSTKCLAVHRKKFPTPLTA